MTAQDHAPDCPAAGIEPLPAASRFASAPVHTCGLIEMTVDCRAPVVSIRKLVAESAHRQEPTWALQEACEGRFAWLPHVVYRPGQGRLADRLCVHTCRRTKMLFVVTRAQATLNIARHRASRVPCKEREE